MIGKNARLSASRRRLWLAVGVVILCGAGSTVEAKIKCWTNSDGIREFGNVVPPEYAQQSHEEKSAGGVTLETTGRAKSLEELEAERLAEQEKAAAAISEREQAAKDRVLLDTFSSEDDMLLARDGQIAHLDSQVKLTESHIEKLKKGLDELVKEAADYDRRGETAPEKLLHDIQSLGQQIRDNEAFIETKALERAEILKNFEANITRFRALKAR